VDPVTAPILIALLVAKVTDFVRFIRGHDWSSVLTQLLSWVAGVVGVFLTAHSDWGDWVVPGLEKAIADVNGATQVLLGMAISSFGSIIIDFKKAIDKTDSAVVPQLGTGRKVYTDTTVVHEQKVA
jgi:hypothetical protein